MKFPENPLNIVSLLLQGANASALEKEIGPEQFPVNEHYFGLVNVSMSGDHTVLHLSWFKYKNICLHPVLSSVLSFFSV